MKNAAEIGQPRMLRAADTPRKPPAVQVGDGVPRTFAWCTVRRRAATRPPTTPRTNVLVPLDSTTEISNTPTSKSVVVRFAPDSGTP